MSKLKKLLPKRDLRARWLWVLALALTAVKLGLCSFQLIVASPDLSPIDAAGTYLFASCTKQQGDALWLYRTGEPADVPLRRLEMPPMRHLAGSDEQGFYWSAEGVLPAQAFRTAFGRVPRVGGILPGNAFLYDVSEPAFGAAFPVPTGAGVPTAAGFGTFVVVPY